MRSDYLPDLRQFILNAKPRTPKPLGVPPTLQHGWLLPYLLLAEDALWGRWNHWHEMMLAGRVIGQIPPIDWESGPLARKMLEASLTHITQHGSWQGWDSWQVFDYFMDWLLCGLGHNGQPQPPDEPAGCSGASDW